MERLGCKYLKRVLGICVRRGIINMRLAIIEFIVWLSERLQPRLIGDFHFTSFLFCYYLIKSLITIMSSLLNKNWWGQSRWILFCFSSSIKSRSYVFIQLLRYMTPRDFYLFQPNWLQSALHSPASNGIPCCCFVLHFSLIKKTQWNLQYPKQLFKLSPFREADVVVVSFIAFYDPAKKYCFVFVYLEIVFCCSQ